MGTIRIGGIVKSSPSTQFWLEADWVAQSGNSSLLRVWLRAANGPSGSSGSSFSGYGIQEAHSDYYGRVGYHEGSPFLPSGYGQNQTRWHDQVADLWYNHDSNGYLYTVGLAMVLRYGSVNETHYGSIPAPPRIAQVPAKPVNGSASNVTATNIRLNGVAPDDRGSGIVEYQFGASPTAGGPAILYLHNSPVLDMGGLTPGTNYNLQYRARNGVGWSEWSNGVQQSTLPATPPGMTLTPSLSGQSMTVALTPPGGASGVTKYSVERRIGSGAATLVESATSPIVVSGLTPGSTHQWRSSAWFGSYQSPWTDWTPVAQPNPNTNPGDYFDGSTAARPDLTFAWSGTAHQSASTASGLGVTGWSVGLDAPAAAVLYRVTGGMFGSYAARLDITRDSTAAGQIRVGQSASAGHRSAVEAGSSYVGSIHVRPSRSQRLAARMAFYNAAGAVVGTAVLGAPMVVGADAQERLVVSAIVPAGAETAIVQATDVAGDGWSAWLSGDTLLLDGAMISLASLFPYFDGSTADTAEYDYAWEGTANASASARNELPEAYVDVLADPDCPPIPQPPSLPTILNDCIDETGTWRRYTVTIPETEVRRWAAALPTLVLETLSEAERQVRIRYYANPDGASAESVTQDGWDAEQIITYIPPNSEFTLDGVTQRMMASVNGADPIVANRLLYGTGGVPPTWPELRCGVGYVVTLDVPLDAPAGNLQARVLVTQRM